MSSRFQKARIWTRSPRSVPRACRSGRAPSTKARADTPSPMHFSPDRTACAFPTFVPYTGQSRGPAESSTYDAQRVCWSFRRPCRFPAPGFTPAGTEQGFNVFSKESMKAGTGFDVSVSGTAPPPSEAQQSADQVNGRDSGNSGDARRLRRRRSRTFPRAWTTRNGFCSEAWRRYLLWAWDCCCANRSFRPSRQCRRALPPSSAKARKAQRAAHRRKLPRRLRLPRAKIENEVNTDLDSLKDTLLRIELRHQAGTISDEEYARERGRAEQMLRDLVQG